MWLPRNGGEGEKLHFIVYFDWLELKYVTYDDYLNEFSWAPKNEKLKFLAF